MDVLELKEFLNEKLDSRAKVTDQKFENIIFRLKNIEADISQNNVRFQNLENRVTAIEINIKDHYNECPNNDKIRDLEDKDLSRISIKKWQIAALSILSGILTLIVIFKEKILMYLHTITD